MAGFYSATCNRVTPSLHGLLLLRRVQDELWEECARWRQVYAEREYDTRLLRRSLTPLQTQWIEDADLVEVERLVRLNLDFDMKRELVDPDDVDGLITAHTRPWSTVEEFDSHRDALEDWKKSRRRVLKTVADLRDLNEWNMSRPGQRASGSTMQSGRPPLVNAFLKAVARQELDPGQWPYQRIADVLRACGWPVSIDTVKQSKRRGELTLRASCLLSPEDLRFARAVYRENPDCRLDVLVAEGSQAVKALADARIAVQRQTVDNAGAPQERYPLERRRVAREVTRKVTLPHPPIGASVTSSKQSVRHRAQPLDFQGR